MQVDDVTKVADGIWYTRGTVTSFLDSATVLRIERSEPARKDVPAAVVAGSGRWKISDSTKVEDFFIERCAQRYERVFEAAIAARREKQ